jgi:hypothetical protein
MRKKKYKTVFEMRRISWPLVSVRPHSFYFIVIDSSMNKSAKRYSHLGYTYISNSFLANLNISLALMFVYLRCKLSLQS